MKYGNRMKCAVDEVQLNERLSHHPSILEFHLVEKDLRGEGLKALKRAIGKLQNLGIKVYLHHPMKSTAGHQHILSTDHDIRSYFRESCRILANICEEFDIKVVVHCNYTDSEWIEPSYENSVRLKEELEVYLSYGRNVFLWENSCNGLFSNQNPYLLKEIIEPLNLPVAQDISHSFIALRGSHDLMLQTVQEMSPFVQYYHVVDSMGDSHDGLELGKGKIRWRELKDYIVQKDFIYEVVLSDYKNSAEMTSSAYYFETL